MRTTDLSALEQGSENTKDGKLEIKISIASKNNRIASTYLIRKIKR